MRTIDLEGCARSLLRIVAALLFAEHGLQKLFGWLGGHSAMARMWSEHWVAGILETVGGVMLALGLFTRPVAFLLCGEMAVAYFQAHFPHGFWPIRNGGEPAVLYCFIFLYLCIAGGGPIGIHRTARGKGVRAR